METVNISLPKNLSSKVEAIITQEGYASKSEFFRTLIRLYLQLTATASTTPFLLPFKKRPLSQIETELKNTGFYKKEFVDSVVTGLTKSSLYANQKNQKWSSGAPQEASKLKWRNRHPEPPWTAKDPILIKNGILRRLRRTQNDANKPMTFKSHPKPKNLNLYSFRLDQKWRVIFIVVNQQAEVIDINPHYQ